MIYSKALPIYTEAGYSVGYMHTKQSKNTVRQVE